MLLCAICTAHRPSWFCQCYHWNKDASLILAQKLGTSIGSHPSNPQLLVFYFVKLCTGRGDRCYPDHVRKVLKHSSPQHIRILQHRRMFKPRKFDRDPSLASVKYSNVDLTTDSAQSTSFFNTTAFAGWELTKNDKYCVSRLPALPVLLESTMDADGADEIIFNGYADHATKFALVVGPKAINVWPYRSTDTSPLTFEFPLGDAQSQELTLAILTRPSGPVTMDPGLVIIETIQGRVRFYESVQHAPALGIINSANIETRVDLKNGEYITLAENVEPAGIVVATNFKRVVLVSLRDVQGSPSLSTVELTGPLRALRLFSFFSSKTGSEAGDEIVNIRLGGSNGNEQEIIVQDSKGTYKKFYCNLANGRAFVDHKKTLHYNLTPYLENNIDGIIPGALINTKFVGIWNLNVAGAKNLHTALVSVESFINGTAEIILLLVTLKIDQSGVLLYGSHQLPKTPSLKEDTKPQLFIPSPGATAFVVVGNSVIMTDLNTPFLQQNDLGEPSFTYFKPQWEDVVKLKPTVEIVGLGYENLEGKSTNPSLVLITKNYGVLRVERFPETTQSKLQQVRDPTDPVYLLKSHMQQAVFYRLSEAMDFDVDPIYLLEDVNAGVKSIVDEVMNSLSSSLPPIFSSTRDSLLTRANALRELVVFVQGNFVEFWPLVIPQIVDALEKLDAAQHLWALIDSGSAEAALLKERITTIIQESRYVASSTDIVRSFFTYEVEKIDILTTELLKSLQSSNYSDRTVIKILIGVLYEGVLKNEARYVSDVPEIKPTKHWLYKTDLLDVACTAFQKAYGSSSRAFDTFSSQDRLDLVSLCEALYYTITRAIQAMQDKDDHNLASYVNWYRTNRKVWIAALLKHGLVEEAKAIAEKFQDFFSLAYILETERDSIPNDVVDNQINQYIEVHGYEFASKLFEHYMKADQVQRILLNYKHNKYLDQFLRANSKRHAQVAWIHHLQCKDFENASKVLNSLASRKETDNQENRELCLSLAKLTAIAAKFDQHGTPNAMNLEYSIIETENNLVAVRIQNHLHEILSGFVQNKKELITMEYFQQNFVNPNLGEGATEEVSSFFDRFANQKVLTKEQLIAILTSVKPIGQLKLVFSDALKVSLTIENDLVFQEQATKVWLRLLTTTDDWDKITDTSENTDDVNKAKVRDSIFFHTLSQLEGNSEHFKYLDVLLSNAEKNPGGDAIEKKLHRLVTEKSLKLWVESIKADVIALTR